MEKVKVTKAVAELIESLRGVVGDGALIKLVSAESGGDSPILTAAIAIHHGYEVEMTPEEKVADYYGEFCGREARAAIRTVLSLLGISIKGVNA